MKKKNGFTLIELIGIIVILGVLVVIGVPSLLKTLNNNKNKEYETFEKNLFLATESYIQKHQDSFTGLAEPNGAAIVGINTLVDVGLIKSSTVNPKTGKKINLNDFIKVTNTKNQEQDEPHYNYQYLVADKLESWEYAYKEEAQQFTAKKDGHYKLEVWGAQGGSVTDDSGKLYEGGYGAYASGIVELSQGETLYIFTGGMGNNQNDDYGDIITGGYNGGGIAFNTVADNLVASGGGATQISVHQDELSALEDFSEDILIVGAGGGGAFKNSLYSSKGGPGGGYKGGSPLDVLQNGGLYVSSKMFAYYAIFNNNEVSVKLEDLMQADEEEIETLLISAGLTTHDELQTVNMFGSFCLTDIQNEEQTLFQSNGLGYQIFGHFGHGNLQQNDWYNDFDFDVIGVLGEFDSSISGGGGGYTGGGFGYNIGGNGGFSHVAHSQLYDKHISCYKCDTNEDYFTYSVSNVSKDPISKYAKKGNGYAKITYLGF